VSEAEEGDVGTTVWMRLTTFERVNDGGVREGEGIVAVRRGSMNLKHYPIVLLHIGFPCIRDQVNTQPLPCSATYLKDSDSAPTAATTSGARAAHRNNSFPALPHLQRLVALCRVTTPTGVATPKLFVTTPPPPTPSTVLLPPTAWWCQRLLTVLLPIVGSQLLGPEAPF
jgi:hypothetical protein